MEFGESCFATLLGFGLRVSACVAVALRAFSFASLRFAVVGLRVFCVCLALLLLLLRRGRHLPRVDRPTACCAFLSPPSFCACGAAAFPFLLLLVVGVRVFLPASKSSAPCFPLQRAWFGAPNFPFTPYQAGPGLPARPL